MNMECLRQKHFSVGPSHCVLFLFILCQLFLVAVVYGDHAKTPIEALNLEKMFTFKKQTGKAKVFQSQQNRQGSQSENFAHGFSESEIIVPIRLHHVSGYPVSHGRHFRKRDVHNEEDPEKRRRRDFLALQKEFRTVQLQQTQNVTHFNDITSYHDFISSGYSDLSMDFTNEGFIDDVNYNVANYSFSAFGENYKFHLTPFTRFLALNYSLRYLKNVSGGDNSFHGTPRHCFYSGFVNDNQDHKVVLSLCSGMFGTFRTNESDFLIQPDAGIVSGEEDTKPHRIFRRSTRRAGNHGKLMCGYIDPETKGTKEARFPNEHDILQYIKDFLDQPTASIHTREKKNRMNFFHKTRKKQSIKHNFQIQEQEKLRNSSETLLDQLDSLHRSSLKAADDEKTLSRRKRYLSLPRTVEVMVTADNDMLTSHDDIEHYVLTLMAIVNHIFRDPSIENQINIVVVELVLIDDSQVENGPHVVRDAHTSLKNFCEWQFKRNNPDDSHPIHYDTAVLLTGKDICRSETACDTLGLAELGTMCDLRRSCAINEDNGLSTAFTIAHEIGHQFNAPHDDSAKCSDSAGHTPQMNVMSPTLDNYAHPWSWSKCSAKYITSFLDNRNGECLLDEPPQHLLSLPMEEPGELFNANDQCRFIYGEGTTHCNFMFHNSCKRLWCTSEDIKHGCRTPHLPWADGTRCGNRMWCQQGECVSENRHRLPIDGNWGDWGKFGDCSRSCGGGVKIAERDCNNPKPEYGGQYCVGKRKNFRSCNYQACPLEQDFRIEQCALFNNWSLRHNLRIRGIPNDAQWTPKYDGIMEKDQCKLTCQIKSSTYVSWYVLRPRVINGTPCVPDSHNICVEGVCKDAGCDHVLGSTASEDECGVCRGDNTTCKQITGTYNIGNKIGYNLVTVIPAGASRISITQQSHTGNANDNNYLVLRETRGNYILNGNRSVMKSKQKIRKRSTDGSGKSLYICDYSGTDNRIETINCSNPITVDISVEILSAGNLMPPNIQYKYNVPLRNGMIFRWKTDGPWEECSKECKGTTQRKVLCVDTNDEVVSERKCSHLLKPISAVRLCNNHCDFKWYANDSSCSSRCGKGMTLRLYQCWKVQNGSYRNGEIESRHLMELVSDSLCSNRRPQSVTPCQGSCLMTNWIYGEWKECSVSCGGGGSQSREIKCKDIEGNELDSDECEGDQEPLSRPCTTLPCPQWATSTFSQCAITCGHGIRSRRVWCENQGATTPDSDCDVGTKPVLSIPCKKHDCPKWKFERWTQCSVTCGEGTMKRLYRCVNHNERIVNNSLCNSALLRPFTRSCSTSQSCGDWMWTQGGSDGFPMVVYRHLARKVNIIQTTALTTKATTPSTLHATSIGIENSDNYHDVDVVNVRRKVARWRTGAWTACSATCGAGIRLRYVSCRHDVNMKEVDEGTCGSPEEKPPAREDCRVRPCRGLWRTGEWSKCSLSCGNGVQKRVVECRDLIGRPASCDLVTKPHNFQACKNRNCPKWQHGEWGECSRTCGGGNRTRTIACVFDDGRVTQDENCDVSERPTYVDACGGARCRWKYHWKRSIWGSCSATCGRGIKSRLVHCVDRKRRIVSDELCVTSRRAKPRQVRRCSTKRRCPKWRTGNWSQCSSSCGEGRQSRSVVCKYKIKVIIDQLCDVNLRPDVVRSCNVTKCPLHHWHVGPWSECSVSCGLGVKKRLVECRTVGEGRTTGNSFCLSNSTNIKPSAQSFCDSGPCASFWKVGPWKQCSLSCGPGVQRRSVKCIYVHYLNYTEMEAGNCDITERPHDVRDCNKGSCDSPVFWRVGAWSECSATCGEGTSVRKVVCTKKDTLATLSDSVCLSYPSFKPDSHSNCKEALCIPESCNQLKLQQTLDKDGEVYLKAKGKMVKIYCHKMNTTNPTEFLTLPSEEENYSEIFGDRLIDPNSCPANGTRLPHCVCHRGNRDAGYTWFQKLRINIGDMRVIGNDFTFATTKFGKPVAFGVAGDCYSRHSCPQGTFHINLKGIKLVVSKNTRWRSFGIDSSLQIDRQSSSQIINGKCGGYCSRCQPDPSIGLILEHKPELSVATCQSTKDHADSNLNWWALICGVTRGHWSIKNIKILNGQKST